tara:strand:+ start:142 stop:921 length:780 start_codon:yes stop_codon:yes gene_type:complete
MKICVLIKQVPDKDSPITISEDNLSITDNNITWVSNESDNYALEEALIIKEKNQAEVVVCTLGNESARQVLKDAMAKGADRGIFISDEKFNSIDILTMAKVFTSVLKEENFDLFLSGLQSDDQGNSQLGILIAELLKISHASLVMSTNLEENNKIKVKRELEGGWFQWTTLNLPASISIQSGINTPRYATLKGIMMVKNKIVNEINSSSVQEIDLTSNIQLNKISIPEKSKETIYLDGTTEEITDKLVKILKNDIKVIN